MTQYRPASAGRREMGRQRLPVDRSESDPRKRLIINFHGIGDPGDGIPDAEVPYWCPRAEWSTLVDRLAEIYADGVRIEITFDDGNISDVEDALPALQDRALTATFFVCAGRLGKPRYLSDDHVRVLQAAGMGIGSHGWDHRDLRTLSAAEMIRETSDSGARIAEEIGGSVDSFAVPFGSYDRRVLRNLSGYARVMTSDRMLASPSGWLTPRYSYHRDWDVGYLGSLASSATKQSPEWRQRATALYKRLR